MNSEGLQPRHIAVRHNKVNQIFDVLPIDKHDAQARVMTKNLTNVQVYSPSQGICSDSENDCRKYRCFVYPIDIISR